MELTYELGGLEKPEQLEIRAHIELIVIGQFVLSNI